MPHINLDVDFATNPKVLLNQPLGQLLYIRADLYACKHLTDGLIPKAAIRLLAFDLDDDLVPVLTRALVESGLWHDEGTSFRIHDYLKFQLSKKEVEELRERKRQAGQLGGLAKSKQRSGSIVADCQQPASAVVEKGTDIPKPFSTPISDIRCPISDVQSPPSDTKYPITNNRKKEKDSSARAATAPATPKSSSAWQAYSEAYEQRYRVVPVRNAGVNAQLCRVVDKLGIEEAPLVAGFFVTHNEPFYVKRRHPVELLLRDAEGLRTQWATGTRATTREAHSAEQGDNANQQLKRVLDIANGKGGARVRE